MPSVRGPPPRKDSMSPGRQLQFLATKVIPPRSAGLINRPRLINLVSQLQTKRLAVIKAPAGFGKTSVAAAWSERLRQDGHCVAWLTIDADDDDPPRFLFYVSQALQRACDAVGAAAIELIDESFLISSTTIISTLINELSDVDEEVCLFLEDYHRVTNPGIHEAVVFFLKHAPSHCHVVITTRVEPPFPLASLGAQNQLLEIDASELRFDLQETADFLEQEKPGTLDLAEVALLHRKTEGWPAALRIIASTSSQSRKDFGQYVQHLSGAQRPIGAYLAEMLDDQPGELVLFMLRTAILGRLCAELCEAVTGESSSSELLASMEKRQLLLTPLDEDGQWYRYHALLVEYLKQRLQSELGNEIPGLHQRASRWFASKELWTDAVQHAISAGDVDQAISWIKNCAMTLVKQGDLFTLLGWQRLFPTEVMRSQPEARLAIAWGLALAIRFDESLQLLGDIERDMDVKNPADADALACECQAIRSVALSLKDIGGSALPLAQKCLKRSSDPWTANVASNVVRYWHLKAGDLKNFYATPWIPYSLDDDRRNVFASVYRRCIQGVAEAQQLRFGAAERYYLEALQLAERHVGPNSVAAALPASLIARIRYEQGRLDEAESMLIDRVPFVNTGAMLECVWSACFVSVRVAVARTNLERAYALLERTESQGATRGWGRLAAAAVAERARLYLNEGRISEGAACLDRLEQLAAEYPASTSCAWSEIDWYAKLTRAHLASTQGLPDDAIPILNDLQREVAAVNNHYFALRVATHLSVVRFSANQVTDALSGFRSVINVAAQAGIHQLILDEGPDVGALLTAFHESAERTKKSRELIPYVGGLIADWRFCYQSQVKPARTSSIAETLSAREGEILKLIAEGLSNKEIARSLAITPETVKSHVKHVFTKLGVEKRVQAVSRAQSLGLVSTRWGDRAMSMVDFAAGGP
jgi:LuxR family transcriptional regulator, maltose regulon positive regulatory protein